MFNTISEIKQANRDAGFCYWEPATVRFFNGKTDTRVYGGRYFVDSIRFNDSTPREYMVKVAQDDGSIDTVSRDHESLSFAREAAARLASGWIPLGEAGYRERIFALANSYGESLVGAEYHPGADVIRFASGNHCEVTCEASESHAQCLRWMSEAEIAAALGEA